MADSVQWISQSDYIEERGIAPAESQSNIFKKPFLSYLSHEFTEKFQSLHFEYNFLWLWNSYLFFVDLAFNTETREVEKAVPNILQSDCKMLGNAF